MQCGSIDLLQARRSALSECFYSIKLPATKLVNRDRVMAKDFFIIIKPHSSKSSVKLYQLIVLQQIHTEVRELFQNL